MLLTAVLRLSLCSGGLVPCPPCDGRAVSRCPPVPVGCQPVKEPGCGCCMTCALLEGQACGVYTGTCTRGLRCLPNHGEEKPLHALLHGKGLCRNENAYKAMYPYQEPQEKEVKGNLLSIGQKRKMVALNKARGRQNQLAHQQTGSGPQSGARSPEREYTPGPCRLKLDATIAKLKMNPRVVHLPNCDKRGFYKRKQCQSSLGRSRGLCWCVDRLGVRGTDYSGLQLNCKKLDHKRVNNNKSVKNNKIVNNNKNDDAF